MRENKAVIVSILLLGVYTVSDAQTVQFINMDAPKGEHEKANSHVQNIDFAKAHENQKSNISSQATITPSDYSVTAPSYFSNTEQGFEDIFIGLDVPSTDLAEVLVEAAKPLPSNPRSAALQTARRFAGDARLEYAQLSVSEFATLFAALIKAESNFNHWSVSEKGAIGLSQLMPATAEELGVNPYSMEQNLYGGAEFLLRMIDKFGDPETALAAYNAGPQQVIKHKGIPPFTETQEYIARIKSFGADSLLAVVRQRQLYRANMGEGVRDDPDPSNKPDAPIFIQNLKG